jgi:hypothetical protein
MAGVEAEVTIEHRHPQAGLFVREHGPVAVAVLEDLLCRARRVDGELVVRASSREVAARLGFLSKDSANRRIRQLSRAGVLCRAGAAGDAFVPPPAYVVHLAGTGISVAAPSSRGGQTTSTRRADESQRLFPVPETGSRGARP